MPCCFKSWDAPSQVKRREECMQSKSEKTKDTPKETPKQVQELESYIKGPDKFPLEQGRWGYLPISLQLFFQFDNQQCADAQGLKQNHTCILRHGVEISNEFSFIACIADLYVEYITPKIVPTIHEMQTILAESVSLDLFTSLQNGNLVSIFETNKEIQIDKYTESRLYKVIDTQNSYQMAYLERCVSAYENYIDYLRNSRTLIDHTYLWDLVCTPNPKLFPKGINLVILEAPQDDATDNIELLCPTNHYAATLYDTRKSTFILFKSGLFYEPIYTYKDSVQNIDVKKTFNENSVLHPTIKDILQKVKSFTLSGCKPLPSLPKVYSFKSNLALKTVLENLEKNNVEVLFPIINYNNKIVGLVVLHDGLQGFIPCAPSGYIFGKQIGTSPPLFINDTAIWSPYNETLSFLRKIKKDIPELLVRPVLKVLEGGLVIGFITETNQFVQLSAPAENIEDGLEVIEENNHIVADTVIFSGEKKDEKRQQYLFGIELESNLYQAFRNTLRILLNRFESRHIRDRLKDTIMIKYLLYNEKMKETIQILHELLDPHVSFIEFGDSMISDITTTKTCLTSKDCDSAYCLKTEDTCQMLIPSINLINGLPNATFYFSKLADELIRYTRLRDFIFDPKIYLSFVNVAYQVNEDEVILLQSLLTQEYFENLIPVQLNKYIKTNTFDTAQPADGQRYTETIKEKKKEIACDMTIVNRISGKWRDDFPETFKEVVYQETVDCGFNMISKVLEAVVGEKMDKKDIQKILIEEYDKLMNSKIYKILISQGKGAMIKHIQHGTYGFEDLIMSNHYYLTNFDLWILANKFKAPIVFISSTKLIENQTDLFATMTGPTAIFIRSSGVRPDRIPKYRMIVNNNNEFIIPISLLASSLQDRLQSSTPVPITTFVSTFQPPKKKLVVQSEKRKLKIEE